MEDQERFKLINGPYAPPAFEIGQRVECSIKGEVVVCGWTSGRISWPWYKITKPALVLCGDLERAVLEEAAQAVGYWWGVSSITVTRWRKFLKAKPQNPGTLRLQKIHGHEQLTEEQRALARRIAHRPEVMRRAIETRRERGSANLKPWTPEEEALLGTMADREVAQRLGRAHSQVGLHRRFLGIAAFGQYNSSYFQNNPDLVHVSPEKIFERRLALNISQSEAARRSGWHNVALSQIESGLRTRIQRANLEKLAAALECEPRELLQ